jgi:C4-dicarboxylate-specific signal transduction histidine kinase
MKKTILLYILTAGISFIVSAQAPDLDRVIANITVAAPPVEALDNAAIQLHYFDSIAPTPEQEAKMLTAYKALSAGFAANVHYKHGYNVFEKYLNLKEKVLARKKTTAITNLQNEYKQKDKADEDNVVKLQNEVAQLNLDAEGFISKRKGFKNIFSVIIVVLSMVFAASLFRSGVRLKNLNAETKANQDKLAENHRLSSLGYLADGIPATLNANKAHLQKAAIDAKQLASKGKAENLTKLLDELIRLT